MSSEATDSQRFSGHKRSRSPGEDRKAELEAARRARMARLRQENEQEERKLEELEKPKPKTGKETMLAVDEKDLEGLDEEEQMQRLLGFGGGFGTTKGQKVEDNHRSSAKGAAAKHKARKYRQYMNRKNGFNRPLDKMD